MYNQSKVFSQCNKMIQTELNSPATFDWVHSQAKQRIQIIHIFPFDFHHCLYFHSFFSVRLAYQKLILMMCDLSVNYKILLSTDMDFAEEMEVKFKEYCLLLDTKIIQITKLDLQVSKHCDLLNQFKEELFFGILGLIVITALLFVFKLLTKKMNTFQAKLVHVRQITHDTKIFTFDLPVGMNKIGLNIGEHLQLEAVIDGKVVARKYTPISRAYVKRNSFELLIKIYRKTATQPGGIMTQYIDSLKVGDKIKVTLPYGRFNYLGNSQIQIKQLNGQVSRSKIENIYMVGGGTGITPLYQVIQYVSEVQSAQNRPNISLLFANRSQDDILMKNQLEDLENHNEKFKCYFSIDKSVKEGWEGLVGFVDEEKIRKTIPEDVTKTFFAVCGPPILCNIIEKLLTTKFNVNPNQFFRF